MDTEMTCYESFAEVTEDFYCSAVDVLKILVLRLHDYHKTKRPSVLAKLHDLAQSVANLPDKVRHKQEERGL